MELTRFVVLLVGLMACIFDVRTRRIPNELTFGGALAGLVAHAWSGGAAGAAASVAGWATGVALFLPWFALRGMGAGDVKLLAAFGAWLGAAATVQLALSAAIAGGVMAVAIAAARACLGSTLANVRLIATTWMVAGLQPVPTLTLEDATGPRLAYAIPLTVGAMVTLWL
jgi:prepilin peptidase CpaA